MGRRAPILALILAFSLISLTGIPPTAGFMGKLYLFSAAVKSDLVWLVVVGVVNSVLSAYYYVKVIRTMYMERPESEERVTTAYVPQVALYVSAIGILALGVFPGPLIKFAETAAAVLFL